MKRKLTLILLLSIFLFSCAKTKSCKNGGANLKLSGFDTTSLDTIKIQSFKKNGLFDKELNSSQFVLQDSTYWSVSYKDSLFYISFIKDHIGDGSGILEATEDHIISFNSKIYKITKMRIENKTQKCGGLLSLDCQRCYSPVKSLFINDKEYILVDNYIKFEK